MSNHGLAMYCEQLLLQKVTASLCHFCYSIIHHIFVWDFGMSVRNWKKLDTLPPSFLGVQNLMICLNSLKLESAKRYIKLMTCCNWPLMATTLPCYFWSFMKKKDVSLNYRALWILQCVVFTIFIEVWKIQKSKWMESLKNS